MTATERVTQMASEFSAMVEQVRAEYTDLAQGQRLAARHGMATIEDAIAEEAKQRLRRNAWAAATSR